MASSCDVSDPFASTDSWTHQATTLPRTTTTPWRTPAGNLGRSETSPPRALSPALPQWEALGKPVVGGSVRAPHTVLSFFAFPGSLTWPWPGHLRRSRKSLLGNERGLWGARAMGWGSPALPTPSAVPICCHSPRVRGHLGPGGPAQVQGGEPSSAASPPACAWGSGGPALLLGEEGRGSSCWDTHADRPQSKRRGGRGLC